MAISPDTITELRRAWQSCIGTITTPARNPVNGKPSWICPLCRHGKGGDGMTEVPNSGGLLKCLGCGWRGDIIKLYMQINPGTSFPDAVRALAPAAGIALRDEPATTGKPFPLPATPATAPAPRATAEDYADYFSQCAAALRYSREAAEYLAGRGISLSTAAAAGIGFDEHADPANAPAGMGTVRHPAPRIIVPCGAAGYSARAISDDIEPRYRKMQPRGGHAGLFGAGALHEGEGPVYIAEGAFDALAIRECGARALSLNSVANAAQLYDALQGIEPGTVTLCLALDHDPAGRKATADMTAELTKRGHRVIELHFAAAAKDPSEAMAADRTAFVEALNAAAAAALNPAAPAPAPECDPDRDTLDRLLNSFAALSERERVVYPTGLDLLDRHQGGGLHPGLYVLAGATGLGKTALALQIAAGLAQREATVLYFSLEMPAVQLMARLMSFILNRYDGDPSRADPGMSLPIVATARALIQRDNTEMEYCVENAAAELREAGIAHRLRIIEADFAMTPGAIMARIDELIASGTTGKTVIVVDYLQVMAADEVDGHPDRRERIDLIVTALKRISRSYAAPVLLISALNRMNYRRGVIFEALKESGTIEYTADVIYGLDPDPETETDDALSEVMRTIPRRIRLTCLKNRYGEIGRDGMPFYYHPAADRFVPDPLRDDRSEEPPAPAPETASKPNGAPAPADKGKGKRQTARRQ